MAILKVAQMGHPVLRRAAEPVDPAAIPSPEFQGFCDDLLETMLEYDGAGLAAPQVHESLRVVVLSLSHDREPDFLINPVITPLTEETSRTVEGCLSVEGLRAAVDRPNHIQVEALDRNGEFIGFELKGFPAVVVQHECDHLDGVLFVDRCDPKTMAFLSEYRRHGLLGPNGEPAEADFDDDDDEFEDDDLVEETSP